MDRGCIPLFHGFFITFGVEHGVGILGFGEHATYGHDDI